jgi:hypothetical protein
MMAITSQEIAMSENTEWERLAKGLLKAELKRRNVTYAQLVDKLADVGVTESEPNIRNKLARGKFTAVFMLQCLKAVGVRELRLDSA